MLVDEKIEKFPLMSLPKVMSVEKIIGLTSEEASELLIVAAVPSTVKLKAKEEEAPFYKKNAETKGGSGLPKVSALNVAALAREAETVNCC